jgi:hypothetical protein
MADGIGYLNNYYYLSYGTIERFLFLKDNSARL